MNIWCNKLDIKAHTREKKLNKTDTQIRHNICGALIWEWNARAHTTRYLMRSRLMMKLHNFSCGIFVIVIYALNCFWLLVVFSSLSQLKLFFSEVIVLHCVCFLLLFGWRFFLAFILFCWYFSPVNPKSNGTLALNVFDKPTKITFINVQHQLAV